MSLFGSLLGSFGGMLGGGGGGGGGMSSGGIANKTATTANTSSTNQTDQRWVLGNGSLGVGPNASYRSDSTNSGNTTFDTTADDHRAWSNSGNWIGADSAAITARNAQMLESLGVSQTDGIKAIAAFGRDAITSMGASATDLYARAASNNATAWSHTIDASESVLEKLMASSQQANDAAKTVAQAAIASFQPTDNKLGDAVKYAAVAAGVLVAWKLLKKA